MAKRRVFFCSIHGGPIRGRGWGGHKSHGTCPNGKRLTEKEYIARGGDVGQAKVVPPRRGPKQELDLETDTLGAFQKELTGLRNKITAEIVKLETRLDHLRDGLTMLNRILKPR